MARSPWGSCLSPPHSSYATDTRWVGNFAAGARLDGSSTLTTTPDWQDYYPTDWLFRRRCSWSTLLRTALCGWFRRENLNPWVTFDSIIVNNWIWRGRAEWWFSVPWDPTGPTTIMSRFLFTSVPSAVVFISDPAIDPSHVGFRATVFVWIIRYYFIFGYLKAMYCIRYFLRLKQQGIIIT